MQRMGELKDGGGAGGVGVRGKRNVPEIITCVATLRRQERQCPAVTAGRRSISDLAILNAVAVAVAKGEDAQRKERERHR